MDLPIISTTFTPLLFGLRGTVTLAFGEFRPGHRAYLTLRPLTATLWSIFREPCIKISEKEAAARVQFDWPPTEELDCYDLLLGTERLGSLLEGLRGEHVVTIAEDPAHYKPRHLGLASESVELHIGACHAAHCSSLADQSLLVISSEERLRLAMVGRECWNYDPAQPCRFALRITVEGAATPDTANQQLWQFTQQLADSLKKAYAKK